MNRHFSLFQNADGSAFFLERAGEKGCMEFVSLSAAIRYARLRGDFPEMAVIVFGPDGSECRRVPLDDLNEQAITGSSVEKKARCG